MKRMIRAVFHPGNRTKGPCRRVERSGSMAATAIADRGAIMKANTLFYLVLLAAALALAPAFAADMKDLEAAMGAEGLQPVKSKQLDMVYARPGASLASYKKVMLDPVEVSFAKNWDPKRTGSNLKLGAEERESIRAGVAKITQEQFARQLQAKNGYPIVNAAGPDVLRAKARVVNLYVNAPDAVGSSGRTRTYTLSAGEATLFLELFDSETGQILARVIDHRESRNNNLVMIAGPVQNAAEAEALAAQWATVLRKAMDRAHAASGGAKK
jgi:hypothetical protein